MFNGTKVIALLTQSELTWNNGINWMLTQVEWSQLKTKKLTVPRHLKTGALAVRIYMPNCPQNSASPRRRPRLLSVHLSTWNLALSVLVLGIVFVSQLSHAQDNSSAPASVTAQPSIGGTAISTPSNPAKASSIAGTVVDKDGDVVPNASVVLTAVGSPSRQLKSAGDGSFIFANVTPGAFELEVKSPGFAAQTESGVLQAGEDYVAPPIQLVVATTIEVEVNGNPAVVAEEQIHVEEKQRVLGVIPNFYVSYVPDAAPLNTRQKFQLGWKSTIDPFSFGIAAFIAGIEQADNQFSGYGQGGQGYAKRFGASYADLVSGTFIGGAILPSIFKQDPRYFYKGTGSRKSRFFYAVASAVICKGDNGRWQPNYSNMLGSLAAGGISNLYYPASDRNGVGLTFENALIGIGGSAASAVVQEFFLRKITPHASDPSSGRN
jgi:hypothetical protein